MMKKLALLVLVVGLAYVGQDHKAFVPQRMATVTPVTGLASDRALGAALTNHRALLGIQGQGVVIKLLPDDTKGIRHQRFILQLGSAQTLLIAHNIDLAPRIPGLKVGDQVEFKGDYEWNPKGGVIHWTHRDPAGRHASGWLKHEGRLFQ